MRMRSPPLNQTSSMTIKKIENVDQLDGALTPSAAAERARQLAVSGASKIIGDRASDTIGTMNAIQNRLRQHQNESVQASFDSYVDSQNSANERHSENGDDTGNNADLRVVSLRRIVECRSSKLIDNKEPVELQIAQQVTYGNIHSPFDTRQQEQKLPQQHSSSLPTSRQSLQLNQDSNVVSHIKIRGTVATGVVNGGNRKNVRKIKTNAQLGLNAAGLGATPGAAASKRADKQFNKHQLLEYNRDNPSPVIITSLQNLHQNSKVSSIQMKNSIVVDMRSATPRSANLGDASNLGTVPNDDHTPLIGEDFGNVETAQSIMQHDETDREQNYSSQQVTQASMRAERTKVPLIFHNDLDCTVANETTDGSVSSRMPLKDSQRLESTIFIGANTVRLSLFENKHLDKNSAKHVQDYKKSKQSPNQLQFRQNATYNSLIATLDQIAAQIGQHNESYSNLPVTELKLGQPLSQTKSKSPAKVAQKTAGDDAIRRLFAKAILLTKTNSNEMPSGKQWRTMTPYEKSKVVETFLHLQRDAEKSRKVEPHPNRISQDLSLCLNVGEIKPSPNPFIKAAEKKLGSLREKDSVHLVFDDGTLRDPQKIISTILSQHLNQEIRMAEQQSENLHENHSSNILPQDGTSNPQPSPTSLPITPKATLVNSRSATESQIFIELEHFRQQQEILLRENQVKILDSRKASIPNKDLESHQSWLKLSPSQKGLQENQCYYLGQGSISIDSGDGGKVNSMASSSQDALLQPLIEQFVERKTLRPRPNLKKESSPNVSMCRRLSPRMNNINSPYSSKQLHDPHTLTKNSTQQIPYAQQNSRDQIIVQQQDRPEEELMIVDTSMSIVRRPHMVMLMKHQQKENIECKQPEPISITQQQDQSSPMQDINFIRGQGLELNLRDKIRDALNLKEAARNFSRGAPAVLQMTRSLQEEDLNEMTQMNLQAISLTKKHQQSLASPPFKGSNHPVAKQNVISYHLGHTESGNLKDLKLIVQPLVLNTPQVAAVAQARVNRNGQQMGLEQLSMIVNISASPSSHKGLSQLEERLRRENNKTTMSMTSNGQKITEQTPDEPGQSDTNSDGQGPSPSHITHLNEPTLLAPTPTLVNRFSKHTLSFENVMNQGNLPQQSSERGSVERVSVARARTKNSSSNHVTQLGSITEMSLGMVQGKQMNKLSRKPVTIRHSQERVIVFEPMGQGINNDSRANKLTNFVQNNAPAKTARDNINSVIVDSITTKKLIQRSSSLHAASSMTANQVQPQSTVMINKEGEGVQSIGTNGMNENQTLNIERGSKRSLALLSQRSGNMAILSIIKGDQSAENYGAPQTFYNEGSKNHVRSKASSQLVVNSPSKQGQHFHKAVFTPALQSAETPLKLVRGQDSGEFKVILSTEVDENKPMTQIPFQNMLETPLRYSNGSVQLKHSSQNVCKFHETANFAAQMHWSTQAPINGINQNTFNEDNVRKSYATAISFMGMPSSQNKIIRVREGSQDHSVATIHSGGINIASPLSSPRSPTHELNSNQIYVQMNQASQQPPMLSRSNFAVNSNEIFQDKRAPKGNKLFIASENDRGVAVVGGRKATQASLKIVNPMARGGQQAMMAFSNRRRKNEKIATPIDKLLLPNELTELQRFIKGHQRKQSTGQQHQQQQSLTATVGALSGEQYFGQRRPTRDLSLNQVNTARILQNSASSDKASGLEVGSKLKAMMESPRQIATQRYHKNPSHLWQPVTNTMRPIFTGAPPIKAQDEAYEMSATNDALLLSARASISPTNTVIANDQSSHQFTATPKGPIRGRTIKSSNHLQLLGQDEASMGDVKMIGLKAVLNQNDSQNKLDQQQQQLRQLIVNNADSRHTLPSLPITAITVGSEERVSLSGSVYFNRTPQQQTGETPIIGIIGVDFEPSEGNQLQGNFSPRTDSQHQALLLGMGQLSLNQTQNNKHVEVIQLDTNRQKPGLSTTNQCSSPSSSKLKKHKDMAFVSVEGQHISIADGVLPLYREKQAQRQHLAESARKRYASCASRNGAVDTQRDARAASSRRTVHQTQINHSLTSRQQPANSLLLTKTSLPNGVPYVPNTGLVTTSRRQQKKRDFKFLFNDVKNWKKSVQRNNELISRGGPEFATLD